MWPHQTSQESCARRGKMAAHVKRLREKLSTSKVNVKRWRCAYEDSQGRSSGVTSNLNRHLEQCHLNLTHGKKVI